MTRILSLVSLAVVSVALQAQSTASPQAPDPAMTPGAAQTPGAPQTPQTPGASQPGTATDAPQAARKAVQVQAASVSAELTKGIDTKKAKVGDEVNAKTTDEAKLPDGTALPKGTKLVGNVIDVKAKSKQENNSHLVLSLNRAVLKDGQEVPIRAAVTSMTAPSMSAGMDMPSGGGGGSMSAPSAGGGGGSTGGGGGSSGGAAPMPSAPSMPSGSMSSAQSTPGQMLKSAKDSVAVGNKPRVMLSAPATPESAGVLDAQGENISLESGTKFTANVASAKSLGQGQ